MSDVNLVFSVNSVSSSFTVETTTVNVTPNTTAIRMYAGYAAYPPEGSAGNRQVLFNDAGIFGGDAGFTFNKTSSTLTIANINVANIANLGAVSNLRVSGGGSGQYLISNGAGGVSFATLSAGGSNTQVQYNNNGNFAGMANVTYSGGNLSLGSVNNVKINGGTNGYVLQTDGTGNLSWTAQTGGGGGGNGIPGGANTQIQFNDAGDFAGSPRLVFDNVSNSFTAPNTSVTGNLTVAGSSTLDIVSVEAQLTVNGAANVTGNITVANIAVANNISGVNLTLTGRANISGNINSTGSINAGNIAVGNITGSNANLNNIVGNVITANSLSGVLTSGSQNNITQVGSLSSLTVVGTTKIQQAKEKVLFSTTTSGTINFYLLDSAIVMASLDATGSFNLNVTGNSITTLNNIMLAGESITCTYINKNAYPAFIISSFSIDGTVRPIYWTNDAPTIGTPNAYETYNFNIIKTSNDTFVVLGIYGSYI